MALPDFFHLEIVTPDRQLFSGDADAVTVPARTGYLGILPGHAPLLAELGIGMVTLRAGDREQIYSCFGGFVEVLPERVVVLAEKAEAAGDIDVGRAEQSMTRADRRLHSKDPAIDYGRAMLSSMRATGRLEAARLYMRQQSRH